ncbi:pyridoxamine 5'-phosphate oxidase [Neisseria animalis]|uniref:Pyridoxine/pyridoxamine 5'-phosphate oxidase n=1 Tax=Neisseria animalis TaxID=492 RepID=A0A5P3MTD9_NEIAN|nr:pyridoxamine 5'-phosphate oxidase [Neisseria animalis]QEY24730.1 pyridoxamine 5'-phosphate oxidase [Neisseria animalis]ROW31708.1 pyridoxamine 5'-phosphate oxidase [Neisseria animalis]VEE07841.1 pyridoxamine 5'-phosphate oxidase [Neisseria animalis]
MDLHNIREDYSKRELSEAECDASPIVQFEQWLDEAIRSQVNEPTAVNVAAVDGAGRPNNRVVLLKEVNPQGFVFFTNYQSRKGRSFEANPFAAMTFFWPELERQVRIEGRIEKLDAAASDEYFESRPYTSRIGAWASAQSEVLSGKAALVAKAAAVGARHPLHVPRPPHWGGYIVIPDRVEFWQGRPSRLHDRIQYRLENGVWIKKRLSP